MKNKRLESLILIFLGLIIIGAGLFVYFFANTIYPNSDSSRVQDLNFLLEHLGKTGTAILFSVIGVLPIVAGIRKLVGKS